MTKLWTLPLWINPTPAPSHDSNSFNVLIAKYSINDTINLNALQFHNTKKVWSISNITHISMKEDFIKFYNQCIFSSPSSTWITSINNHHFTGWSGLIITVIRQLLPISTPTIKWYTKQPPHNMLSTTKWITQGKSLQIHTNYKGWQTRCNQHNILFGSHLKY